MKTTLNIDDTVVAELKRVAARQGCTVSELVETALRLRDFEVARSRILGSLLEAAAHGLRNLPGIYLERLPRMADFALWATACETASWPAGTFAQAYQANRRTAIEDLIDADPVAARVRQIMANRSTWTGSASELLRMGAELAHHSSSRDGQGWPKNPRELAGRLRRAQTFLRTLGMEMAFGRAGRVGTRTIMIRTARENTVSTVSSVRDDDSSQPPPAPAGAVCENRYRAGGAAATSSSPART
jgi:hypothetical protein